MAEGKEPKKKKEKAANAAAAEMQRVQNMTSGEILRQARTEKKLGLEEVSSAIHIRVAQLRAIEEGNIEALPGMTYALGFVRSYANYLKINSAEVVNKFKMEHGAMKPPMPELQIPAQVSENRMPDPMIMGVTAFGAIMLLLIWTIFSDGDDNAEEVANAIPPAPVAEAPMMASNLTQPVIPLAVETPVTTQTAPVTEGTTATTTPVIPVAPAPLTETGTVDPSVAMSTVAPVIGTPQGPAVVPLPRPAVVPPQQQAQVEMQVAAPQEEIVIKRSNSRIVIKAREASWIQVDNARRKVIAKKVLKAGDQFFVPQEEGMRLITTNAGGIDIFVDGVKSAPIGKPGEIVRGLPLDASQLTRKRVRVNQY